MFLLAVRVPLFIRFWLKKMNRPWLDLSASFETEVLCHYCQDSGRTLPSNAGMAWWIHYLLYYRDDWRVLKNSVTVDEAANPQFKTSRHWQHAREGMIEKTQMNEWPRRHESVVLPTYYIIQPTGAVIWHGLLCIALWLACAMVLWLPNLLPVCTLHHRCPPLVAVIDRKEQMPGPSFSRILWWMLR